MLRDERVLDRIIDTVPEDGLPLLEIGAGDGILTTRLAHLERPLVSIELDPGMAHRARRRLRAEAPDSSAIVLEDDILDTDPDEALSAVAAHPPYGLIGNLPYAITALVFRKFLERETARPEWMLVMTQLEVAQRVTAVAGKSSLLSVSVQFYAQPELLFTVEREAFSPPPQVRSAVLLLRVLEAPAVQVPSVERFFEVVRAGFRSPRKQLHNALAQGVWTGPEGAMPWLNACGIDSTRRPGTLTLEEWARLAWWRERELGSNLAAP